MTDNVLLKALDDSGIPRPPREVVSGRYTRWGKSKEFYAIRLSDGSGFYYGNFKDDNSGKVVFKNSNQRTDRRLIEEAKRKLVQDQNRIQERISESCEGYWQNMSPVETHEYLTRKRVKSYGLKQFMDKLVIPAQDIDGKIWSFQYISPNGAKHFRSGGRKNGCFYPLGDLKNSSTIYICEGYATAATIYNATTSDILNFSKVAVVAFDAGNLYAVTEAIRQRYPDVEIVICADNDAYGPKNTGLLKAQNAAKHFNAKVVFPEFKDTSSKPTDFNDLLILEGEEVVINRIMNSESGDKIASFEISNSGIDGFQVTENALTYYDEKRKIYIKISSPLKVVALTRELEEENVGRLVEFKDRQGKIKQVKIFDSWLSKDGSKIHDILYKHGLDIGTDGRTKRKLNEYLNLVNPEKTITYTLKSGWHGRSFLTANKVYGKSDGTLIHIPAAEPAKFSVSGTLEDWQKHVAALCINNSRLMLAVSAAFASMILTPCEADNFFLHFYGRSSQGKTTMLDVAASVYGDHSYTRTWRMTDNGLEGIAMAHNDLCLFLDEISECDPFKIGAMAYMLVNGSGKTRATTSGLARKVMRWTLGGVSTGEEQLSDVIKTTGKTPKAGQLLRILSIPALPEGGYGLFEDIHDFKNSADFAITLKLSAQKYHGTAFQAFVRAAIADYDNIKNFYSQEMKKAKNRFLPPNATGQDFRAFKTFATCGIGGMLATKYSITGWDNVDIMESIMKNFNSWLENKGGVGSQEDKQALKQIQIFFEKYGDSKFQFIDNKGSTWAEKINERAGYRTNRQGKPVFFAFKTYFEEVIARGLDVKHVKNLLRDQGILELDSDGKHFAKVVRINQKVVRMYVINSKIFGEEEND